MRPFSSFSGFSVVVTVLIWASVAQSAPMTLAVEDFKTQGASYSVGQSVIEILSSKLAGNRNFRIVERRQLDSVARHQKIALSGMVDPSQAVKIGRLVGAKYYIQGAVSNFGVLTLLTARIIDVERGTMISAYQSMTQEGERGILLATRVLASDILASLTGKAPTGAAKDDYRRYLYDALGYYNKGDYSKSLRYWKKMLQMAPKNATLHFIVAAMHYSRKRYRDAELAAREATTFDTNFAEAYLLAGKSLFMRGKNYEATDFLENAAKLRPQLAEPCFLIGQAYKNRGRLEEAMEYFSMAIERDSEYIGAYVALGQMLLEAAQLDLASEVLSRAVIIDGKDIGARFLLGTTLLLKGDEKGARNQSKVLRSIDPLMADKLDQIINAD